MHGISWIPSSVLALVLGVVLAAPAGAVMPDAWITMKTKLALLTTAGVSGMAINVDTVFGRVTLHGTVRSAADRRKPRLSPSTSTAYRVCATCSRWWRRRTSRRCR